MIGFYFVFYILTWLFECGVHSCAKLVYTILMLSWLDLIWLCSDSDCLKWVTMLTNQSGVDHEGNQCCGIVCFFDICYNQRSYINNSLKDVVKKKKVQKNLPPSLSKMEAFLLWKGCISLYLIVQKKGNVKSFTINTRLRKLILIVVILFFL